MIILPAIDIINKQPVRLYQGDYAQKEIVGESITELGKQFEKQGAQYLHLVDLDGAKEGKLVNQQVICETAKALTIPVEVGGICVGKHRVGRSICIWKLAEERMA